jgi:hypothetical protein
VTERDPWVGVAPATEDCRWPASCNWPPSTERRPIMWWSFFSVVALVGAICLARRATTYTRRLQKFELCMDEFTQGAEALLRDEDTPEELVSLLEFMRRKAVDPWAPLDFMPHLLSKDRHELAKTDVPPAYAEFLVRRPELARLLARTSTASMLAMTYRGYFVGGLVRLFVLFDAKTHSERMRDIATHCRPGASLP